MIYVLVAIAAIGTLLLPPNSRSHALSSTHTHYGSAKSPRCRHVTFLPGRQAPASFGALVALPRQSPLRAIAENTITTETNSESDETDIPKPTHVQPGVTVIAGPGMRITSVSSGVAVEQGLWENGSCIDCVDSIPFTDTDKKYQLDVDFDPDPDSVSPEEDINRNVGNNIISEMKNEGESSELGTGSNSDELDETESTEDSGVKGEKENDNEPDESALRSAIAKSSLLHRAGIAGAARKSSRSNGRSSRAKSHVIKSRRGTSRSGGVGGIKRVLGTVRTAAAAAAREKSSDKNEGKPGGNMTTDNSLKANPSSSNDWNAAIQLTVTTILRNQDAGILQQSVGGVDSPLPPGTTSMGLLGDVVQDQLPSIPPLPGTFLVRSDVDLSAAKSNISIRSSVPHSTDDAHIANLRLSVFSRFDEEQQMIFRSRSVEVLNVRRRRGAVVLVAEVPNNEPGGKKHLRANELQARIMNGHAYGDVNDSSEVVSNSSPSLTVSVRGAKITSVSSGVALDHNLGNKENVQMTGRHDNSTPISDQDLIIGSVECSHQEFRGTMLGNSRPKGSLMYVTEVAVRTDARRFGAGAMLMRGVNEVAALRHVETIYLHVDVANRAACAMYEKCGYRYLDKREPIYAQFTASLNLHDGAMHGRKHHFMCKDVKRKTTWLEEDDLFAETILG